MPKTKLSRPVVSCWEKYRGIIMSRMVEYDFSVQGLAIKMGISYPTMAKYLADPGSMTLDTMRRLNRILDIRAEAVREALAVT